MGREFFDPAGTLIAVNLLKGAKEATAAVDAVAMMVVAATAAARTMAMAAAAAAMANVRVMAAAAASWTPWLKFVHVGPWRKDGDK